jgi:glycosyltransferase involved in cell wall biosynthesis
MEKEIKNILFVIPEMSMGGAQRSLAKISELLSSKYRISIVVFNKQHTVPTWVKSSLYSLDVIPGTSVFSKIISFLLRIWRLRELKKKLAIDLTISFLEGADYINILSRRNDLILLSIRGSKIHDENMLNKGFRFRAFLIRLLYRRADGIVCVSEGLKHEMVYYFGIRRVPVYVIYNFYNLVDINRMAEEVLSTHEQSFLANPVLAMSGRLAIEKGNEFILHVFAALKIKMSNAKLILIGDGPLATKLIKTSEDLGLKVCYKNALHGSENDVWITGERANVFNLLAYAKLYILNSSSEGFPNGLAEALALGVPVIAADCPYGPREMIKFASPTWNRIQEPELVDSGILMPLSSFTNESIALWANTIYNMMNNTANLHSLSIKAKERMRKFTEEEGLLKWLQLIQHIEKRNERMV